jgi:hypothetical protein
MWGDIAGNFNASSELRILLVTGGSNIPSVGIGDDISIMNQ